MADQVREIAEQDVRLEDQRRQLEAFEIEKEGQHEEETSTKPHCEECGDSCQADDTACACGGRVIG